MFETMEAMFINYMLHTKEVEMHKASQSPCPQPCNQEDFDKPNTGLSLEM
jgi:hypothetical protein